MLKITFLNSIFQRLRNQRISCYLYFFYKLKSKTLDEIMQREKLSTFDKLKYLSRGIQQKCLLHQKETRYYCSKVECQQYSYMCQRCFRQNSHGHIDQIDDFEKWTDKIISKIHEFKSKTNPLFKTQGPQSTNKTDFDQFLTELTRVLGIIDTLENKIAEVILQSKHKIVSYIKKYENYGETRLSSKLHLYTNPYILVNKVNSERNDNFIKDLKQCLKGQTIELTDNFNPKYQLITLQNKIKAISAGNNNQIFNLPKQVVRTPEIFQTQKNSLICEGKPQNLFSKEGTILVSVNNQTHIYNSQTQKIQEKVAISINKCSSLVTQNGHSFIGIASNNNKEVLSYINKVPGNFAFEFKIYDILLYHSKNKFYALLARDEGKITIFDLQKSSIIATLQQSHNLRVQFLRYWEKGSKIFSCGRTTSISRYAIVEENEEIVLQFEDQIPSNVPQIQQFTVFGYYLIILTKARNFYVYDMVLKLQYRTNYKDSCRQFDMLSVLSETENHLILGTHNAGENSLHICTIEKQKPDSIILEKASFFNRQDLLFLQLNGNDAWFIRPQESEVKVYNYNLILS